MFSTWIGVVLLFSIFGLFALVVIGASSRGDTYEEKRAKARAEKLQALRDETAKALTTYAWVDKAKGVVRIPIDDAMKLTVAELAKKAPAPANPIATAQANAPAPNTTPAPPASPTTASPSGTPKANSSPTPRPENRNPTTAADNKPSPSGTQPSASAAPAAAAPSTTARALGSPSASSSPPATPLPARGKKP